MGNMTDPRVELAIQLFQDAYQMQMQGELDVAMDLYKKSIKLHPTAEAYTFLGWAYRFQGRLDDAMNTVSRDGMDAPAGLEQQEGFAGFRHGRSRRQWTTPVSRQWES